MSTRLNAAGNCIDLAISTTDEYLDFSDESTDSRESIDLAEIQYFLLEHSGLCLAGYSLIIDVLNADAPTDGSGVLEVTAGPDTDDIDLNADGKINNFDMTYCARDVSNRYLLDRKIIPTTFKHENLAELNLEIEITNDIIVPSPTNAEEAFNNLVANAHICVISNFARSIVTERDRTNAEEDTANCLGDAYDQALLSQHININNPLPTEDGEEGFSDIFPFFR